MAVFVPAGKASSRLAANAAGLVIACGVALRVTRLVTTWGLEPLPDVRDYLTRGADLSFLEPWAASTREPVAMALVKIVAGPFGYSVGALRVTTTICSIVALLILWPLLRDTLPPVAAGTALVVVSAHKLLIYDAASGLREAVTLVLLVALVRSVRSRRVAATAGLVAVLAGVRLELAVLALAALAVGALVGRLSWRTVGGACIAAAVVIVPFLLANRSAYGDPMHHSNVHARFFRNLELDRNAGRPATNVYRGPALTWGGYFTEFVGVPESARRAAVGSGVVAVGLAGGVTETVLRPQVVLAGGGHDRYVRPGQVSTPATVVGLFLVAAAAVGLVSRRSAAITASLAFAVGIAAYAPVWLLLDYRLVSHLVIPLAVVVGCGVSCVTSAALRLRPAATAGCACAVRRFRNP